MRATFSSGLALEERVGYSRAVRIDGTLYISATAPVDENMKLVGSNGREQGRYIFQKLAPILERAGFSFSEVAFARIYLVDDERAESVWEAFSEYLGGARPAIAQVHVLPWKRADMLVEIELTAQKESHHS